MSRYHITEPVPNHYDYFNVCMAKGGPMLNFPVATIYKRVPLAHFFARLICFTLNALS